MWCLRSLIKHFLANDPDERDFRNFMDAESTKVEFDTTAKLLEVLDIDSSRVDQSKEAENKKENEQCFMYRMKSEFINDEIWIYGYLLENEDRLIVLSDQLAESYETNHLEKRYVLFATNQYSL